MPGISRFSTVVRENSASRDNEREYLSSGVGKMRPGNWTSFQKHVHFVTKNGRSHFSLLIMLDNHNCNQIPSKFCTNLKKHALFLQNHHSQTQYNAHPAR